MSIQSMIDAAAPGETVSVDPGIYLEQLVIDKPLTLEGPSPGAGTAVVDAAGMAAAPTLLITSSRVTVRSMTFQNGPGQGIRVGSEDHPNLEEVLIEGCTIRGHDLAGVKNINISALDVIGNLIEDNGGIVSFERVGVLLYPHGPTRVINNTLNNNGDEVFARASSAGLLIEGNTMENGFSSGITLAWDEQNVTIKNNTIRNCGLDTDDLKGGIVIIQSMAEVITGNIIENCRQRGIMWIWVPTEGPEPGSVLIQNNRISNSSFDGIYLFSQGPGSFMPPDIYALKPLVSGNLIRGNGGAGVFVSNAYLGNPTGTADPHLDCNNIESNSWGVYNQRTAVINAVNNWWGQSSGPYHPADNPDGTGNPVSDHVDFIPFREQPCLPPPTGIDCISAKKIYWSCKKHCLSEEVIPVSGIARGKIVHAECLKAELLAGAAHPVSVEKIEGSDQVRVGFYFRCTLKFLDDAGWKVVTGPPLYHGEVFAASPPVQDKRIEAAANVYLECLECFVPEPNLIACFLAKTIVLQLISRVQLLVPTYGFCPEPGECPDEKGECSGYRSVSPPWFSRNRRPAEECFRDAIRFSGGLHRG